MVAVVSENKSFEWTQMLGSTYIVNGRTDGRTDGRTENRTPISHPAKAGATNNRFCLQYKKGQSAGVDNK